MSSEIRSQCIADLLRRSAIRFPNRVAVACGQTHWTFAQFSTVCDRLAAGLASTGIRATDRVAILARNSHAFAALRFAVARLGAVLVPVNFMLNAEEVGYILKHSGASLLATDSELARVALKAVAETSIDQLLWLPGEQPSSPEPGMLDFNEITALDDPPPNVDVKCEHVAQIVYTSGTESLPKGVVLTHEAILHQYVSCIIDGEMSADDRVLHSLPLYHCAQLDCFLGPAVYLGSTSIVTARPDAANLLALIAEHKITSIFAPPTVWISLLGSPRFDSSDLSSLQKGYYGASIMPVEVLREILRRLPAVRLWNFYG